MSNINQQVVITGATGFLGKRLTHECINRGYTVYILTRDIKRAEATFNKLPVKMMEVSITDVESLKKIPEGSRIFHCAAITGAIQASKNAYEAVNVIGTRNLLNVAIEKNAASFTFVSSVSAVGAVGSAHNPITEHTIPNPKTYYGQSKLAAEKMILSLASSLPITIVRPPLIYGEGQAPTSGAGTLFKLSKKTMIPVIGNPDALISLAYVQNVAAGLMDLTLSHTGKEIFNLSDSSPYSLEKLSQMRNGFQNKKYLTIPRPIVSTVSMMSDGLSHLFQKDMGLRSEVVRALSEGGFVMNIDKALRFGYSPKETSDIIRVL